MYMYTCPNTLTNPIIIMQKTTENEWRVKSTSGFEYCVKLQTSSCTCDLAGGRSEHTVCTLYMYAIKFTLNYFNSL